MLAPESYLLERKRMTYENRVTKQRRQRPEGRAAMTKTVGPLGSHASAEVTIAGSTSPIEPCTTASALWS